MSQTNKAHILSSLSTTWVTAQILKLSVHQYYHFNNICLIGWEN